MKRTAPVPAIMRASKRRPRISAIAKATTRTPVMVFWSPSRLIISKNGVAQA